MIGFKQYLLLDATEKKLEFLRIKYKNKIDPTQIHQLDTLDPSNGKYLEWLIKMDILKQFRDQGDYDQVARNLEIFKTKSKKKDWQGPKDINKFASIVEFAETVMANKTKGLSFDEMSKSPEKLDGNTILNVKENFKFDEEESFPLTVTLWKLEDYDDFQAFNPKEQTEWCVAYPDMWEDYKPPYYMLTGRESSERPHELYQLLHIDSLQCMTNSERPISTDAFIRMGLPVHDMIKEQLEKEKKLGHSPIRIDRLHETYVERGWLSEDDIKDIVEERVVNSNAWDIILAELVASVDYGYLSPEDSYKKLKTMLGEDSITIDLGSINHRGGKYNLKFFTDMPSELMKKLLLSSEDILDDSKGILGYYTLDKNHGNRDEDIEKKILNDAYYRDSSDLNVDNIKKVFKNYINYIKSPWPEFENRERLYWLGWPGREGTGNISDYKDRSLSSSENSTISQLYNLWNSYEKKFRTPISKDMLNSYSKILNFEGLPGQ